MGDVIALRIGESLCNRLDIDQTTISSNGLEFIMCKQALEQ